MVLARRPPALPPQTARTPDAGGVVVTVRDIVPSLSQAWPYFCRLCGNRHEKWADRCDACGASGAVRHVHDDSHDADESSYATAAVNAGGRVSTGAVWLDGRMGGGLPVPCTWLLAGGPSSGKTSLASMIVAAWPVATAGHVAWISNEQSRGEVAEYFQRMGVRRDPRVHILGDNHAELLQTAAVLRVLDKWPVKLAVVDSIGALPPDAAIALKQWAFANKAAAILISTTNSEGQASGTTVKRFAVTIWGTMTRDEKDKRVRVLEQEKSRHGRDTDGWSVRLLMDDKGRLAPVPEGG